MKLQFHVRSIVRIAFLCILLGPMTFSQMGLCRAESVRHMEKHIRKMEKRLANYGPGTYLRIVFLDHSQSLGVVGQLKTDSFTFTDAETNATRSYAYADLAGVDKGETYVGEGSRHRHFPRLLFVGVASAAAAGAIAAFTMTQ
jgi:hypothetical protein